MVTSAAFSSNAKQPEQDIVSSPIDLSSTTTLQSFVDAKPRIVRPTRMIPIMLIIKLIALRMTRTSVTVRALTRVEVYALALRKCLCDYMLIDLYRYVASAWAGPISLLILLWLQLPAGSLSAP